MKTAKSTPQNRKNRNFKNCIRWSTLDIKYVCVYSRLIFALSRPWFVWLKVQMELSIGTSNLKISVEFMFMFEVFGTAMKWWIFFVRAEWARSNSFACVRVEVIVKVAWLLLIWIEGNAIDYYMTLCMKYVVLSLAAQGLARQGRRAFWSCKQLCYNPRLIYEQNRWSFFL